MIYFRKSFNINILGRSRRCNNPLPLDGGADCDGDMVMGKEDTCSAGKQCTCKDVQSQGNCEYWKSLGYCSDGIYVGFMTENCVTTCGMCPSKPIQLEMPCWCIFCNVNMCPFNRPRWRLVKDKRMHGWQAQPGVQQSCTTWRRSLLCWSRHRRLW